MTNSIGVPGCHCGLRYLNDRRHYISSSTATPQVVNLRNFGPVRLPINFYRPLALAVSYPFITLLEFPRLARPGPGFGLLEPLTFLKTMAESLKSFSF